MKQLVAALERGGFKDVSYYLNTGNIFFESSDASSKSEGAVEGIIHDEFGLNIKTLVKSKTEIDAIIARMPEDWVNNAETKSNVMFLWEAYANSSILEKLSLNPEYDEVIYESGALLWRTKTKDFNKSGLSKLVGTDMYKHMTIRNCNTARKIQQNMV